MRAPFKKITITALLATFAITIPGARCENSTASDASNTANVGKKEQAVLNKIMHGYVSESSELDPIAAAINDVMSSTISRSDEASKRQEQVKHFSHPLYKAYQSTKNMVNFMLDDRGFTPSIEASALCLDKEVKVHGKASAEYAKQHWLDATHDRVVADVLELASSFGVKEQKRRIEMRDEALNEIDEIAGQDTGDKVLESLTKWYEDVKNKPIAEAGQVAASWSAKDSQTKVKQVVTKCTELDPMVLDITKRAKHFQHGKVVTAASCVFETTLSMISLAPTVAGPAAQAMQLAFFTATGGAEEDKLMDNIYLSKRMQSRKLSMMQQAYWAVDGYQKGVLTNNPALTGCCESLLRRMGGPDLVQQVLYNADAATANADSDDKSDGKTEQASSTNNTKADSSSGTDSNANKKADTDSDSSDKLSAKSTKPLQ